MPQEHFDEALIFNFEFLRQHGIEVLQQLSGKLWTDYNLHDPGVTILEHLCFTFTDLAYRTNFPIQEILSARNGKIDADKNSFFSKPEILTINPVSINDKRKYIIDAIDEIDNAWIEPADQNCFRGVYKTVIQLNKDCYPEIQELSGDTGEEKIKVDTTAIKENTLNKLIAARNLCEDFEDITILKPEFIEISAGIVVESNAVPEEVLANIYVSLENLVTPAVKYATEKELKSKGLRTEEIYQGPYLKNGIIADAELKQLKVVIDPVEFVKNILAVKGVVNIKNFKLKIGKEAAGNKHYEIKEGHFPFLIYKSGDVSLYRNNNLLPFREKAFKNRYYRIKQVSKKDFIAALYQSEDTSVLQGKWRDLKKYRSMQYFFPAAYGLGEDGLPKDASPERRGEVKQLKGYLMLFEQTLLNYLAQLGNVSNFFSTDLTSADARSTVYFQLPFDLPGADDIITTFTNKHGEQKNAEENAFAERLKSVIESDDSYKIKKNDIFDHLLARFNLSFPLIPVSRYEKYYGTEMSDKADLKLRWKAALLKQIKEISYYKFRAFDYQASDTTINNNSGFKKNMYAFLFIAPPYERSLTVHFKNEHLKIIPQPKAIAGKEKEPKQTVHYVKARPRDKDTLEIADDHADYLISNSTEHLKEGNFITTSFFKDQTLAVFSMATDKANYKLLPDPLNNERAVLVFRIPGAGNKNKWRIISRHIHRAEAETLLSKLVQYFRKMSIDSEGFHIAEHILLRPPFTDHVFKHAIIDKTGKIMMWQKRLSAFEESRQHADTLLQKIADSNAHPSYDELKTIFSEWDAVKENNNKIRYYSTIAIDENILREVFDMSKGYTAGNMDANKLQRCIVKQSASFFIDKDFYSNKLSFVFPRWPARFQDAAYKNFAQNFIARSCPVYIQPHFLWLNINRMKDFEDVYFNWLEALKEKNSNTNRDLCATLVQLIAEEKYIIRTSEAGKR